MLDLAFSIYFYFIMNEGEPKPFQLYADRCTDIMETLARATAEAGSVKHGVGWILHENQIQ